MPYSFTQIEKVRSRNIAAAFAFLTLLYAAAAAFLFFLFKNYSAFGAEFNGRRAIFQSLTLGDILTAMGLPGALTFTHWFFTVQGLRPKIISLLRARPPDPNNPAHTMFQNIIEEVRIATGGGAIEGMVVPSMAANACTFSDGRTAPVIAVTEGLLQKLSRAQIEAVVAHEAAHAVSGHSEGTTVISSMFEIFAATLRAVQFVFQGAAVSLHDDGWASLSRFSSSEGKGRGGSANILRTARSPHIFVFVCVVLLTIWLVNTFSMLMRMFISRQREYRADAIAVRLTRNPLALAEALYIIANHRHSMYDAPDSLETMFIINPNRLLLDEQLSLFSDLFSTHPPVEERLRVLLSMAHATDHDLIKAFTAIERKEAEELKERQAAYQKGLWFINKDDAWTGPFNMEALASMDWVRPNTLVKQMGQNTVTPLFDIAHFHHLRDELRSGAQAVSRICPSCSSELEKVDYEGVKILECRQCKGILLEQDQLGVILQRRQKTFNPRIQAMARTLFNERNFKTNPTYHNTKSDRIYRCEKCATNPKNLRRSLFNRYYPIEVDKCFACGRVWFDKEELETMQCMYEIWEDETIKK